MLSRTFNRFSNNNSYSINKGVAAILQVGQTITVSHAHNMHRKSFVQMEHLLLAKSGLVMKEIYLVVPKTFLQQNILLVLITIIIRVRIASFVASVHQVEI